MTQTQQCRQ